jgi:hypothetical protein
VTDFIEDMLNDNSQILVARPTSGLVFTFSNTGKGGNRSWFAMTGTQLISCLEDILGSPDDFPARYEEKKWRQLFADNLDDDVARTMGAVQTLPLFEILAKIIHFSAGDGPRSFKSINLEPARIRQAIALLQSYQPH